MAHNVQGLPGSGSQYGFPFTVDPEKLRARVCVQSEIHSHNKPSLKAAQRKPKERQVFKYYCVTFRLVFYCRNCLVRMENWSHW